MKFQAHLDLSAYVSAHGRQPDRRVIGVYNLSACYGDVTVVHLERIDGGKLAWIRVYSRNFVDPNVYAASYNRTDHLGWVK